MAHRKKVKKKIHTWRVDKLRPNSMQNVVITDVDDATFERLKQDLEENGQIDAIEITPDGEVIDGRNLHGQTVLREPPTDAPGVVAGLARRRVVEVGVVILEVADDTPELDRDRLGRVGLRNAEPARKHERADRDCSKHPVCGDRS